MCQWPLVIYTVTSFYTYGFNGLTLCVCVSVYNGPLIFPRLTSTPCGDEGWVFVSVRCRASDGSCGRVTHVFVLFSGLHESEQCRCGVDVVFVLVSTVGTL